ncbi:Hypothetical protein FKW44_024330 [Caligus rogercresseyi]|uniref:Uncharacterized protein n=1 Tax=Caligus rogercresseyi TaxID=217165 RepID=A0A7T8GM26_CALRO|nr:Hypothetical protein FKW44_024330 [Caligus rogercresseyi]
MVQDEPNGYANDTGGINNSNSKEFTKDNQPKATPPDGRKAVQIERKKLVVIIVIPHWQPRKKPLLTLNRLQPTTKSQTRMKILIFNQTRQPVP